ncbi:MAG: right-handed parallel beta-helix repeat-containing protein [Armatimonadetes bacterium]|nr:right-handed parallel beta-helix repeat-containing protein [Armatimonadota bacterium]
MHTIALAAALLILGLSALAPADAAAWLYVSPGGNDAWSGRSAAANRRTGDGPFRTLERARDAVRKLKTTAPARGGIVVELAGGVYELAQPFALTAEDSGTAESPITWRAAPGRTVSLVGGRVVTGWQPVTDAAVLAKLDPAARRQVMRADLKALGVTDFGEIKAGPSWAQSSPGLEVFFSGEPMTLARWPNEGFTSMVDVLGPTPVDVRGTKGCREGIFRYEGDRPARWVGEPDIMLEGFWFWDWADQRLHVQSINAEKKVITLDPQPLHGFGFRQGGWWYAYNLLCELDQPGEWYLDRGTGTLYFWPPAPLEQGQVAVSVLPSLLSTKGTSHVTIQGLTLECARGTLASLSGGSHTRLVGCTLRNAGSWAVGVSGTDNGVVGCDMYNLGDGGVALSGGDRRTLTPCHNYVENCHLHHFARWNPILKPGVQLDGVGCRMAHNLIHDAPHMAVLFGGNDHLIEYNEIHSVVWQSNDAGVMYAGYNPAMRGHLIRYNYIHHIYGYQNKGCNGIYLDDMFCSATIFGNVFYQVPRAAFIGGGHDNVVESNVFVDCTPALHVDARMMGWAKGSVPIMKQRLEEVPYHEEPWRSRYPQLLTYLEGNYAEPRGNVVKHNICWGGKWDEIEGLARPGVKLEDNLVGVDPKFVDAEHFDFDLRPDSPAWAIGFEAIPVKRIGLYASPERASWPVRHTVRPH